MKDSSLEFRILQLCSGHFLTRHIPDEWYEMTETKQNNFLEAHVWQPLEHLDSNFIWQTIEGSASITQQFIENLKGETTND